MKITIVYPKTITSDIENHIPLFLEDVKKEKKKNTEFETVLLENDGHYFEKWIKFINDNYENLPDYLLLLSDEPIKHSKFSSVKELFAKLLSNKEEFLDRTHWLINLKCNALGYPHHPDLPVKSTFSKVFPSDPSPDVFDFVLGAQSFLSKRRILNRPKSFYTTLHQMLQQKDIDHFTMERLWHYV